MKLREIVSTGDFFRSVEVFPPKKDENLYKMLSEIMLLKEYDPAFISVTYGAGGSTQGRSLKVITALSQVFSVMAHFTCVNTKKAQIDSFMDKLKYLGVENVLALRGDVPNGMTKEDVLSDFNYASELTEYLKSKFDLDLGVAGYPDIHPEAVNEEFDLDNLIKKVNKGAEIVITQLFFDNDIFFRYKEKLEKKGLKVPVIPGVLPITNYSALNGIVKMSGTKVPEIFRNKLEKYQNDSDAVYEIGMEYALKQCIELKKSGVRGIHLYSINKKSNVEPILKEI